MLGAGSVLAASDDGVSTVVVSSAPVGLDPDRLTRARDFVVRNARLLDRHRFACLFDDASPQPVFDDLRAYRNPDGGLGTPSNRTSAVRMASRSTRRSHLPSLT